MKSQSTIEPQSIKIINLGNKSKVYLTKNVEVITKDEQRLYQYDEVVFEINNRPNLTQQIEQNFDAYFVYGEQFMQKQQEEQEKTKEINRLVNKKEQVDENRIITQQLVEQEIESVSLAQHLVEREIESMLLAQQITDLELRLLEVNK